MKVVYTAEYATAILASDWLYFSRINLYILLTIMLPGLTVFISGWIFQKVSAEIVQKGLLLSKKTRLISNRRNLGLLAQKSMRFPSKDRKLKNLSFQSQKFFMSNFSFLTKRA